jgi:NitT/TauT family transport system permease protein
LKPLVAVAPGTRVVLGISFFVLFVAFWSLLTFGGYVSKTFLADPVTMVKSGYTLLAEMGFAKDIGMTVWRVLGGFILAALLALPLGVLMGAYKPVEAFFEPFISFARYLPASAFIPLLILWVGIGEAQKLSVIFIGSFFQLVLMIAVTVGNTRRDLVEAAYTLGVSDHSLVRRVLIPGAAPEIAETLRMVLGWAWTYVIVAELHRCFQRHRPHDHRQPGAAGDRPDHLRDHRHRPDRAGQRLRLQGRQPRALPMGAAGPLSVQPMTDLARDSRAGYERRVHGSVGRWPTSTAGSTPR